MSWLEDLVEYSQANLGDLERDQLLARGVVGSQVDLYRLGYLSGNLPPEVPSEFREWCVKKECGSNHWVLPLTNTRGSILGLQMRSADPKKKGYIDFFSRKDESVLFGLNQAMPHVWQTGEMCIVEGAFDLFPIQRHMPGVVSTLHAGISPDFIRVIKRLVRRLVIVYDNDFAGRDTSYKIQKALRGDLTVDIVSLPKVPLGHDKATKDPCDLWSIWGDKKIGVLLQPHLFEYEANYG